MIINDTYEPYLKDEHRFLVLYGGASSGKSVFAAQKVIQRTKSELGHRFLCLRKVDRTVKRSIFQELKQVIYDGQLEKEFIIYRSDYSFRHANGNEILCQGLDEPEKIKSIQGITGMWIEEATEFTEEDIDQLNLRIRGHKQNYIQYILSFNPISEDHFLIDKYIKNQRENGMFKTVHTTYKDNLFNTPEDIAVIEGFKETNELYYQVYCLGEPGAVDTSGKFLYNFHKQDHVSECGKSDDQPIKLSFDFNLEPFAVSIYQNVGTNGLKFFDKIRLENSDIYQVCDMIKANYPNDFYIATGDRTGYNRAGTVRGKTSYWKIIKKELGLSDSQLRLRGKNLDLVESRVLCNAALKHKMIMVDPSLIELINDCTYAKVDDKGELIKDRVKNKNDFLDTFRYAMDRDWETKNPRLNKI